MSIETASYAMWAAVTVLAVACLAYLFVAYGEIDRTARRALDERLARGEIGFDEYRERLAALSG